MYVCIYTSEGERDNHRHGEGGGRYERGGEEEEAEEEEEEEEETLGEHNVSHSARSCIFYDMASNLTSRMKHNSRALSLSLSKPLEPRICVRERDGPFFLSYLLLFVLVSIRHSSIARELNFSRVYA